MKVDLDEAMKAKSAKELFEKARANGIELTETEAEDYYNRLHRLGELSDEELSNVAGGGCHKKDGRLVVSIGYSCENYACEKCGRGPSGVHYHIVTTDGMDGRAAYSPTCQSCKYRTVEKGLWLCNHPGNMK